MSVSIPLSRYLLNLPVVLASQTSDLPEWNLLYPPRKGGIQEGY